MSYCVKCGHELIEKENGIDGMVPYCPNCQEFRFPMFNSAVSALVLNPKKDKTFSSNSMDVRIIS